MKQYLDVLQDILDNGTDRGDRTGTGTRSIFGVQMRFNLSNGFPLVTTKKVFLKGIIHELLWFIAGDTNIRYLVQNNVHIWDAWPYKEYALVAERGEVDAMTQEAFIQKIVQDADFAARWGSIWPGYGAQWRDFNGQGLDQIGNVIAQIKKNPESRRHMVITYNPIQADKMLLPPCHSMFQFYVANGKLSCQMYQRSADMFLGVPFNIASYALLTMMVAQVTGLEPGDFIHTIGDAHIYHNHFDQVKTQLARTPYEWPKMKINPEVSDIFSFKFEDFELQDYQCHETIKAPIAV